MCGACEILSPLALPRYDNPALPGPVIAPQGVLTNPVTTELQLQLRTLEERFARLQAFFSSAFLTTKEVCARYGCSRSTIHRRMKLSTFPQPSTFPGRVWRLADLVAAESDGRLPANVKFPE